MAICSRGALSAAKEPTKLIIPQFCVENDVREPIALEVQGVIPSYAAGTLYRTGPSNFKIDGINKGQPYEYQHWFDGQAQVHRFRLAPDAQDAAKMQVTYNSRRTVDEGIEKIRKDKKMTSFTFGKKRDLCDSFFHKLTCVFKPLMDTTGMSGALVNVTLKANMPALQGLPITSSHSKKVDTLVARTDSTLYQKLDPETLEPLGYCDQTVLHPELVGHMSASHARTDPKNGDMYNFNLHLGRESTFRIFRASASTGKVDIIGQLNNARPTYMHSLLLTESTVIMCLWGSRLKWGGLGILWNRNLIDAIEDFNPNQPAEFVVIDRTPACRGIIATYTAPAFFCFHTVNAYEERTANGRVDIVADLCTYDDLSILHGLYYKALLQDPGLDKRNYKTQYPNSRTNLTRFRLPDVPVSSSPSQADSSFKREAMRVSKADADLSPELPIINPRASTSLHRFVYGVRNGSLSAFWDGLIKHDTSDGTAVSWSETGQTPGEPIFVADPEGRAEDDGVLLSVVLDGFAGSSYLLCLDARTMEEMGRATAHDVVVPYGFHGEHIPERTDQHYSGGD